MATQSITASMLYYQVQRLTPLVPRLHPEV
jgi:hypothetical protein